MITFDICKGLLCSACAVEGSGTALRHAPIWVYISSYIHMYMNNICMYNTYVKYKIKRHLFKEIRIKNKKQKSFKIQNLKNKY